MRVLSGIKPTGRPHLGNYFGAIRQYVDLQNRGDEPFYFIADLHALDSVRDAKALREYTRGVALDYLACGLDPERSTLFVQSDIPEVSELMWILGSVTPMGLLERMHAYKAALADGRDADFGLFAYPVLMAADILAYDSDLVPVGQDQKQHVELTRDVAIKINLTYSKSTYVPETKQGGVLVIPEPLILDDVAVVPGTDGRKMSKSYGNTIPLFGTDKEWKKAVMGIVTDSKTVEEPKDPETCNVFRILRLFVTGDERAAVEARYRAGGEGYGVFKGLLLEKVHQRFDGPRARRAELEADPAKIDAILARGAAKARATARVTLDRVRVACGLQR
jgi:tryptophanyl-tRNA synthetase